MGKMFRSITRTWSIFTGCLFNCYNGGCWARKLALGKLKKSYPNGFVPEFHPERLRTRFKDDDFVFVSAMGDITFAKPDQMIAILEVIQKWPQTRFLLCSKNPECFRHYGFPDNVYLGTTLETDYEHKYSQAPRAFTRLFWLSNIEHGHKFVSIEPVMDFDLHTFSVWLRMLKPEIVEVGADNYHCNLPEPPPDKLRALLTELRKFVPVVVEKDGLERLL